MKGPCHPKSWTVRLAEDVLVQREKEECTSWHSQLRAVERAYMPSSHLLGEPLCFCHLINNTPTVAAFHPEEEEVERIRRMNPIGPPSFRPPNRDEMHAVFAMCRQNQWNSVLNCIRSNPLIPITSMIMDNHISTTILHQGITSKGDTKARTRVIREILDTAPKAAAIKNGYGSLPLHVIAQRNTKMDAPTKELLINELVSAYKGALVEQGGVGKRTPLHIIFTDYISPRLTEMMIKHGQKACFMRDKKGYLPAHVACSRHCSPEKLEMLLRVNPSALTAQTNDGETLLTLATSTATKSHPNYALIDDLRRRLDLARTVHRGFPVRVSPEDGRDTNLSSTRRKKHTATMDLSSRSPPKKRARKRKVTEEDVDDNDPANLLLHFSRHTDKEVKCIARV